VEDTLRAPVCKLAVELDVRSEFIRVSESAAGNWFADIIRHAYDDALCINGCGGSDAVLICAGTLRGDSVYNDTLTLGNLMEILPFEDPIVVVELDGSALWEALESSLSTWPAQEGRFPVISGLHICWDSTKPPGQRVKSLDLIENGQESSNDIHAIERKQGGKLYKIVTREYMAQGHDGFEALKGCSYLIDDESGQMMSTLVRRYLMGCHYVNKMVRMTEKDQHHDQPRHLHNQTWSIIEEERENKLTWERLGKDDSHQRAISNWRKAFRTVRDARKHFANNLSITSREHMSDIDAYQGAEARRGRPVGLKTSDETENDDLLVAHPVVDGRLKDEGR
jgi:5'-nucleotidase